MSRIAGIISRKYVTITTAVVAEMLKSVQTVSAWNIQTYTSEHTQLGAIGGRILSASQGDILVVLDGNIYNQEELGAYQTDADCIADMYRRYGIEKTLNLLNGDFAFALFDVQEQKLFIARDRIGVKPLYYAALGDGIAFASRPKSLFAVEEISTEPDPFFVARYAGLHYRYIDNAPHQSPYKAIRQLPAAHYAEYSFAKQEVQIRKYWSLDDLPNWEESEEVLAERYRELLKDAVRIRYLRAQKPVFTLSGGMDSSSVLASSVHNTGEKQHAVSTVYVDKTYDESDEIASMLDSNVSEWHKVVVGDPDVFTLLPEIISANDEPIATGTWLSHYLLCQNISGKNFHSVFGGLGGDELNAGEYEYFFFHFADLKQQQQNEQYLREVEKWVEYHDHPIFKKNLHVAEEGIATMTDLSMPGVCRAEPRRLNRYISAIHSDYYNLRGFEPVLRHPFSSYLKNRTFQDMFYETAPCCLRAEDRQTMAFGIENFVPFFDYRLVEFMFRVPGTMKIRNGVTKILLREAMKEILPEETRTRIKKTGWNAPAHKWFSGKGKEPLYDMIHSQAFRERGIWNVPEVLRIADEHQHIIDNNLVQDNHMMFLWQMVNTEIWLSSSPK
jgi:asparagine synthase (glutamine-hydrolysing)